MSKIVYLVRVNSDLTEGRGYMNNVALFDSRYQAEKCADDQPKIMNVGKSTDILEMVLYDSYISFKDSEREKIRERALAKLSIEERIALGLIKTASYSKIEG